MIRLSWRRWLTAFFVCVAACFLLGCVFAIECFFHC